MKLKRLCGYARLSRWFREVNERASVEFSRPSCPDCTRRKPVLQLGLSSTNRVGSSVDVGWKTSGWPVHRERRMCVNIRRSIHLFMFSGQTEPANRLADWLAGPEIETRQHIA